MPIILLAISGDEYALRRIVEHYQRYIRMLATRPIKDAYGNECSIVDEQIRLRLENKLMYSIVTGFSIIPQ